MALANLFKVVTKDSAQIIGYPQLSIHANHMVLIKKISIEKYSC
jgi:hypothetical protein